MAFRIVRREVISPRKAIYRLWRYAEFDALVYCNIFWTICQWLNSKIKFPMLTFYSEYYIVYIKTNAGR